MVNVFLSGVNAIRSNISTKKRNERKRPTHSPLTQNTVGIELSSSDRNIKWIYPFTLFYDELYRTRKRLKWIWNNKYLQTMLFGWHIFKSMIKSIWFQWATTNNSNRQQTQTTKHTESLTFNAIFDFIWNLIDGLSFYWQTYHQVQPIEFR